MNKITAVLKLHKDWMAAFIRMGVAPEAASLKALRIIKDLDNVFKPAILMA